MRAVIRQRSLRGLGRRGFLSARRSRRFPSVGSRRDGIDPDGFVLLRRRRLATFLFRNDDAVRIPRWRNTDDGFRRRKPTPVSRDDAIRLGWRRTRRRRRRRRSRRRNRRRHTTTTLRRTLRRYRRRRFPTPTFHHPRFPVRLFRPSIRRTTHRPARASRSRHGVQPNPSRRRRAPQRLQPTPRRRRTTATTILPVVVVHALRDVHHLPTPRRRIAREFSDDERAETHHRDESRRSRGRARRRDRHRRRRRRRWGCRPVRRRRVGHAVRRSGGGVHPERNDARR